MDATTATKRERGVWRASGSTIGISFQYKGERCREFLKLKPTEPNLAKASRFRISVISAIENGTFNYAETFPESKRARQLAKIEGDAVTIKQYLTEWIEAKKGEIQSSTYVGYRRTVFNILIPEFGHMMLTEFKARHMKAWAVKQDCSKKRINNIISNMRNALDDAVFEEIITINPLHRWKFKKIEPPKDDDGIDPFSVEEREAILEACHIEDRNMFEFAFWSGVRGSELIALRWSDVDWLNGRIHIRRKKVTASKVPEIPKTSKSNRILKLLPPALAALKRQRQHTQMLETEEIFVNPISKEPYTGDKKLRRRWKPALMRAGVRYRSPKQTRHTFASVMFSANESPPWIQNYLGHSTLTTTLKCYARYIPAADPDGGMKALEKFGSVVNG